MSDDYTADAAMLALIKAEIDADPDAYLLKTNGLTSEDMTLTGTVVQTFNFTDINARRIIDSLRHAALGPQKQNGGVLQDAQVYEKLIEAAELLPPYAGLRKDLIKAAKTFQMHHALRHSFAHWAMRRIPGHDALFMMTYNAQEGERRNGKRTDPHELTYGVMPLAPVRSELKKLEGHGQFLATAAARIYNEMDEFKAHFEAEKLAAKAAKYEAGKTKKGAKGPPKT